MSLVRRSDLERASVTTVRVTLGRGRVAAAIAALAFAVIAAPGAQAATTPIATSTAGVTEGQTFDIAPFSVTVRAGEAVSIVAARIINSRGETQDLDVAPYSTRNREFEVELPVLEPHGYRLYFRVRNRAGQETVGSVGFVVRGCEDERARVAAQLAART